MIAAEINCFDEGWSKLKQGDGAMFRTGLGNSVALKAKSILADEHHHHPGTSAYSLIR